MKVKYTCHRVLANDEKVVICSVHRREISPGTVYLAANDVVICKTCLKHLNTCQKLFQDTRSVAIEKDV